MATYDFSEALVLVTGGGSGIGRAVAIAFSDAGAAVIVADINLDGAQSTVQQLTDPKKHIAAQVDVSNSNSINDLIDLIKSKYVKSPTAVVHAAGISIQSRKGVFDIKHEEWDRVIDVNLKGTFLINQSFGRLMRDEKIIDGTIVNIASVNATRIFPHIADYNASKAGVVSLTRNFAQELAQFKIRVNSVSPGFIHTPMQINVDKEIIRGVIEKTPLGRGGEPEEVARLCLFLCSKESSYITGQDVTVSGGF